MAASHASEFFVTLPSNSSFNYFPQNDPSHYKVKLPYPIQLNGKWEVGLAEISYVRSWPTVSPAAVFEYLADGKKRHSFTISEGYYEDIGTLLNYIYERMSDEGRSNVQITLNPRNNKIVVRLRNNAIVNWKDVQLARILGIKDKTHDQPAQKGQLQISNRLGPSALFIYTDIVSNSIVGDSNVPLLRVVPVDGEHGEAITRTFDRMHYVPLRMNMFETIEVNISRDSGQLFNFQFGTVILKLHFRPRKFL